MTATDMILAFGGLIVFMLGYWLSRLDARLSSVETDVNRNFVSKEEYRNDLLQMKEDIRNIFKILREHEQKRITD